MATTNVSLVTLVIISCFILTENFVQTSIIRIPNRFFFQTFPMALFFNTKKEETFKVYWNSPTFQCNKHGIKFNDIAEKYGIIQNTGDSFRGDKLALLYDPGNFPALLEKPDSKELFYRNGGVPQKGDMSVHLTEFNNQLRQLIPDENFDGLAVIDFESWRPIFRQNFGVLTAYKDASFDILRKEHPDWSEKEIKAEAARQWNIAGPPYMIETLKLAKTLRPKAKWGYYAYPYCFNMNNADKIPNCSDLIKEENNNMKWLWKDVDMLMPSLYMTKNGFTSEERLLMVKGRVEEAKRVASLTDKNPKIYTYITYTYREGDFLTKEDLYNTLDYMKGAGVHGTLIWGSSNDVNTKEKCEALQKYVSEVLGPIVSKFTK